MSDPALLAKTADRLRTVAGFFAFELDRYRQLTHLDPASEFGIPAPSLTALGLCRLPRREHYAHDLTAIATRVGVSEEYLAIGRCRGAARGPRSPPVPAPATRGPKASTG
jgi:hypothetical protein